MTTLVIAFGVWFVFAYLPTMLFYVLARRDVAEARRLRDEARQLAEFAETPSVTRYRDAVALAMQEKAMQEKEGASLQ
jgi:hypothetical protein